MGNCEEDFRWGMRYFGMREGNVFFQVSVEVNRLRGFQEILAHFVVKSTPIASNCNYYKRIHYILCLICKKHNK